MIATTAQLVKPSNRQESYNELLGAFEFSRGEFVRIEEKLLPEDASRAGYFLAHNLGESFGKIEFFEASELTEITKRFPFLVVVMPLCRLHAEIYVPSVVELLSLLPLLRPLTDLAFLGEVAK